jgi:prepilin-type N-terminal cleavage/methylation domain-containing protein
VKSSPRSLHGRSHGFTAVEVLIAMTVMVIGATAVMGMQKTSVQANLDARKADVASQIAHTWVERFRREAMQWTTDGTAGYAAIPLLANHDTGNWFRPTDDMIGQSGAPSPGTVETMSYGFDILGRDLASGDLAPPGTGWAASAVQFCVEARLTPLLVAGSTPPNYAFRLDVRVVWPRSLTSTPTGFCKNSTVFATDPIDPTIYHTLYLATAIAENPPR